MWMCVCDTVLALCLVVLEQLLEEEGDALVRVVGKTSSFLLSVGSKAASSPLYVS